MELQHTAPYTPRQSPTERANRTVKTETHRRTAGTTCSRRSRWP